MVYTPRARRRAGGVEAIASLVGLGVAETNLGFEKSEVKSRLRLVEIAEVPFVEAGRVAGRGGCNQYSGPFRVEPASLDVRTGPMIST